MCRFCLVELHQKGSVVPGPTPSSILYKQCNGLIGLIFFIFQFISMCQRVVSRKSNAYPNVTLACEDQEIGKGAHKVILLSGNREIDQI